MSKRTTTCMYTCTCKSSRQSITESTCTVHDLRVHVVHLCVCYCIDHTITDCFCYIKHCICTKNLHVDYHSHEKIKHKQRTGQRWDSCRSDTSCACCNSPALYWPSRATGLSTVCCAVVCDTVTDYMYIRNNQLIERKKLLPINQHAWTGISVCTSVSWRRIVSDAPL